ncbi:MAG TPA: hypothetical protein VER35_01035 [Candidatus Limnocylindrales bacterium]|nr:hypothetical protein [Candidatus Limnocylindrales bacterium]
MDTDDKNRIHFKFLDGKDEDWYDLKDEMLEIRRCIPSETHQRSATMKILNIQESAQNPEELGKQNKLKQRRMNKREEGFRKRVRK